MPRTGLYREHQQEITNRGSRSTLPTNPESELVNAFSKPTCRLDRGGHPGAQRVVDCARKNTQTKSAPDSG